MQYNTKRDNSGNYKNVILPLIIISNIFPLYGVIYYNWTFFSVVYIYWLELLISSTFSLLKILLAKGDPTATFSTKLWIAFVFFLIRTGIFFFYLLFIITFLGLFIPAQQPDGASGIVGMAQAIYLKEDFYKMAVLSFLLYNLMDFIVHFILNNTYKTALPKDNAGILDIHIFIVHIVVVLGSFLYMSTTTRLNWDHKAAIIVCVGLFVIVKIFADIIRHSSLFNPKQEDTTGTYI